MKTSTINSMHIYPFSLRKIKIVDKVGSCVKVAWVNDKERNEIIDGIDWYSEKDFFKCYQIEATFGLKESRGLKIDSILNQKNRNFLKRWWNSVS